MSKTKNKLNKFTFICKKCNLKVYIHTDYKKEEVKPKECSACGGKRFKEPRKKQADASPEEGQA